MTTPTEYRPIETTRRVPPRVAERAAALGLTVVMRLTVRHQVPTYFFSRDGVLVGQVQSSAHAWLAGYEAGAGA